MQFTGTVLCTRNALAYAFILCIVKLGCISTQVIFGPFLSLFDSHPDFWILLHWFKQNMTAL